ncbi:NRDE protein-domain-containing protein [Trichophaea hybrida]|nr:NRDE protein-domain-containing protein [Trichophaea hybrida]
MCILIYSTTHPNYPLILLSNRDEFLHRPTQRAAYWEAPHEKVFSGRDLARPEHGTWLGVSKNGRLAILTNFREESSAAAIGEKSRGAMITLFLTSPDPVTTPTKTWIHRVLETGEMKGVGGFSMLCGTLRPGGENLEELAIISNRTLYRDDGVEIATHWVGGTKSETHGLSNSLFDDPWPKVKLGEKLLSEAVKMAVEENISEEELLEQCFAVLSHNTLPLIKSDDTYETEMDALMLSIFIPAFDAAAEHATTPNGQRAHSPDPKIKPENVPPSPRLYGTTQQTVILVDTKGRLKYVERTLYDVEARPIEGNDREVMTEFYIEDWPAA